MTEVWTWEASYQYARLAATGKERNHHNQTTKTSKTTNVSKGELPQLQKIDLGWLWNARGFGSSRCQGGGPLPQLENGLVETVWQSRWPHEGRILQQPSRRGLQQVGMDLSVISLIRIFRHSRHSRDVVLLFFERVLPLVSLPKHHDHRP